MQAIRLKLNGGTKHKRMEFELCRWDNMIATASVSHYVSTQKKFLPKEMLIYYEWNDRV